MYDNQWIIDALKGTEEVEKDMDGIKYQYDYCNSCKKITCKGCLFTRTSEKSNKRIK